VRRLYSVPHAVILGQRQGPFLRPSVMPRDKSKDYCLVGSYLNCSQDWWIWKPLGGSTSYGNDQSQHGQTFTPAASDTTAFPVEAHIAEVTGHAVTDRRNVTFTVLGCYLKHILCNSRNDCIMVYRTHKNCKRQYTGT